MVDVQAAILADFQGNLRGELIVPGDAGYDEARTVWNRNINRRPAMIVRCAGPADVMNAVNFASDNNLLVSVRGGGHSFAGNAMAEGGLVVDLSLMNSVRVDPARRIARAGGGTKWGQFDHETQAFGLACTGGTNSDTGIAGLTMGGGHGWLGGKYGLALDNLLSVDIVCADGQLRIASAIENSDLFWAVRGGGGNFGVVTSFEYLLHPVGPLFVCMVVVPIDWGNVAPAKKAITLYHELASKIPDEVNTAAALATMPGGPVVGVIACYNGPVSEGERVLEPFKRIGQPVIFEPMPYVAVQHLLDPFTPEGDQYYEKGHFISEIGDDVIEILVENYRKTSSPGNLVIFQQQGNAANRVAIDATAFAHRDARYNLILIARWEDPGESARHFQWTRELWETTAPYSTGGTYVNMVGTEADEGTAMIRRAYGANYHRLVAVKRKYDPTNLFRHNQNIRPIGQ